MSEPYVKIPDLKDHFKFRYVKEKPHGYMQDQNNNILEFELHDAEEGIMMLSLVDESDEKLFPHSLVLVENEEKIKKDIHCVKLKNGKPQKVQAVIEVHPIQGMVGRAEYCLALSQKFEFGTHMSESTYANLNEVKCDDSEGQTKALDEITAESEWWPLLKKKKGTRGKKGHVEQKGPKLTQRCKLRVQLLIPNEHGGYTVYPPSFSNTIWNQNAMHKNVTNTILQAESSGQDSKSIQYVLQKQLQQDEMHNIVTPVYQKDNPAPELANETVHQRLVNDTNNNRLPDELFFAALIIIFDYTSKLYHLTHDLRSLYPTQKNCESWVAELSPEAKEVVIAHSMEVMSHIPEYDKKAISVVDQLEEAFKNINYFSMMLVMYGVRDLSSLYPTNKECELWAGLSPGAEESLELPPIEETADVQGTKSEYAVVTDDVSFLPTKTEAPQIQQDVTILDKVYFGQTQGKDPTAHSIVAPSIVAPLNERAVPKKGLSHCNENVVDVINRSLAIHEQEDSSCKLPMLLAHDTHHQKHLQPSGSKRRIDAPSSNPSKTKVRIRERNDTDESIGEMLEEMFNGWEVALNY